MTQESAPPFRQLQLSNKTSSLQSETGMSSIAAQDVFSLRPDHTLDQKSMRVADALASHADVQAVCNKLGEQVHYHTWPVRCREAFDHLYQCVTDAAKQYPTDDWCSVPQDFPENVEEILYSVPVLRVRNRAHILLCAPKPAQLETSLKQHLLPGRAEVSRRAPLPHEQTRFDVVWSEYDHTPLQNYLRVGGSAVVKCGSIVATIADYMRHMHSTKGGADATTPVQDTDFACLAQHMRRVPYLSDIAHEFERADLIVCRKSLDIYIVLHNLRAECKALQHNLRGTSPRLSSAMFEMVLHAIHQRSERIARALSVYTSTGPVFVSKESVNLFRMMMCVRALQAHASGSGSAGSAADVKQYQTQYSNASGIDDQKSSERPSHERPRQANRRRRNRGSNHRSNYRSNQSGSQSSRSHPYPNLRRMPQSAVPYGPYPPHGRGRYTGAEYHNPPYSHRNRRPHSYFDRDTHPRPDPLFPMSAIPHQTHHLGAQYGGNNATRGGDYGDSDGVYISATHNRKHATPTQDYSPSNPGASDLYTRRLSPKSPNHPYVSRSPTAPQYCPSSPTAPQYCPSSPTAPQYCPSSPTAPQYCPTSPTAPQYCPTSPTAPQYCPTSPTAPQYCPSSPGALP